MPTAVRVFATGLLVALLFGCALLAGGRLQSGSAPRRGGNPDAAKIANPVPATAESVAAGRRPYTQYCANCHGPTGKGDGTAAGADRPSDMTDDVWDFGSSDGEIFTVIHDGIAGTDMGGYAGRLSDTDIWNVVNYIRGLNKAGK